MTPDEFRQAGHQVVDWLADYLSNPGRYPVLSRNHPGQLIDALPDHAPEDGEEWQQIFADFERHVVPAVTHWNHPGFMAYFANTASPPGILGEMLAAGLNANGILWKSSPAVTELEQVTLRWLRQWMGLGDEWFGVIHDTASTGVMHANSNSVLGTDTTGSRVTGRVNSQGALHASPTGIAHASANSVLKGSTVVSGLLTGLAAGMPVSFNGNTVGTVNRIVTSNDGTVRRVLVTGTDGRTYSLSPTTLSLSGGILTTTTFRG